MAAGLTQWVREQTFVQSGYIFDLILTSELDRVGDVRVLGPLPGCSHLPVVCDYFYGFGREEAEEQMDVHYLWRRRNYVCLFEALAGVDWELVFKHFTVEDAYKLFLGIVKELISMYVPVSGGQQRAPWAVWPPRRLARERATAW